MCQIVQIQWIVTIQHNLLGALRESPRTPSKNRYILRVVVLGNTLETLWNSLHDKFMIIRAFLRIRQ